MISSAIWKKHAQDIKIARIRRTSVCFFHISREVNILLINNVHGKNLSNRSNAFTPHNFGGLKTDLF